MPFDPYSLIGVPQGSSLEQVRTAYHQAVLRCHPDVCTDDTDEALSKFMRINEAYKTICRDLRPATPQDFASVDLSWLTQPRATRISHGPQVIYQPLGMEHEVKVTRPTCDENSRFLVYWLLSLAVSIAVAVALLLASCPVQLCVLPLLLYVACNVVALLAIVSSRQIVWLAVRVMRRALPSFRDSIRQCGRTREL